MPHLQAPVVQRSAVTPHAEHAPPAAPHWVAVVGLTHAPPEQQPEGQLAALQTHAPATHARPAPHAGPAPQRHAPAAQPSAIVEEQAVHAAPPTPQVAVALV